MRHFLGRYSETRNIPSASTLSEYIAIVVVLKFIAPFKTGKVGSIIIKLLSLMVCKKNIRGLEF